MNIRIPKSFNIFGHTYTVEFDSQLDVDHDAVGTCSTRKHIIKLQPDSEAKPRLKSQIEQSYLHELVHVILRELMYNDLDNNEQFIDTFASALHQILTTSEYGK